MTSLRKLLATEAGKAALAVFLISVAVKLLVLSFLLIYPGGVQNLVLGDSGHYRALADSVIAGTGYTYEGHPETYRAPGYPAYFYVFDALHIPLPVASILQILIASLLPALLVWAAIELLALPLWVGLAAGLLTALELVDTYYAVVLMPDVYFAVGVLIAVVLMVRWWTTPKVRYLAIAGVALGLANYMRPAMEYFPLFFILLAGGYLLATRALTRRHLLGFLVFFIAPIIVMAPWYLRNYVEFGVPEFVSVKADTLYTYGAASTLAIANGTDYETARVPLVEKARAEAPSQNLEGFEDEHYLSQASLAIIKAHPLAFLKSYLLGLNTYWFSGNYHYLLFKYGLIAAPTSQVSFSLVLAGSGVGALVSTVLARIGSPYLLIAVAGKVLWLVFVLGAVIGLWLLREKPLAKVSFILFLYSCATVLATTIGIEARHRYYLNPLIFLFFVATLYLLYARTLRRHSHT